MLPSGLEPLVSRILEEIEREEASFSGTRSLRSHSLLVARYAAVLAEGEGEDPVAYYIAGLLHDYGKLEARRNGVDEEEHTLAKASMLLRSLGAEPGLAERVAAILAEGTVGDPILGDADVLSKLGMHGVASFIAKWTARGKSIEEAIIEGLSRELTVAYNVAAYLCTGTARSLAEPLAREASTAYEKLLEELEAALNLGLRLGRKRVEGIDAVFVLLDRCPRCFSRELERSMEPKKGRICRGYRIVHRCPRCGWSAAAGVCVPRRRCL